MIVVGAFGCDFRSPDALDAGPQAEPDAIMIADAFGGADASLSGCQSVGVECAGYKLRTCTAVGQPPVDKTCGWGCSAAPSAHCALLQPSGGALMPSDLDDTTFANLGDIDSNALGQVWHTDTGAIDGVRSSGTGIKNQIDFSIRGNVAVFKVKSLKISGNLVANAVNVRGPNALAIVSLGPVVLDRAVFVLTGDCDFTDAGPGGSKGGSANQDGSGTGAGRHPSGVMDKSPGGSGAAYGGDGGDGGDGSNNNGTAGASKWGEAGIPMLVGGSGGGGGASTQGGAGGGGGGAIQISTNAFVHFAGGNTVVAAGIQASGCGGKRGGTGYGGGGGGAGGAILIEAPTFVLDGPGGLAVNGGGGGGANNGNDGGNGGFTTNRAGGGNSNEGVGGVGGAQGKQSPSGTNGGNDNKNGGGGGGGVGWIRFSTYSGFITVNGGFLSPSLGDATSTSQGTANVQ
jgi:hypothetical protein